MAKVISETPWTGLTFQIWDDGDITYSDDMDADSDSPKAVDVYQWLKENLPEAKDQEAETAKQSRWNAVYGATIGALTAIAVADGDGDSPMPREAIKEFVRVAREVADAAILVDP